MIMNSTLCLSGDTLFAELLTQSEVTASEHMYATEPMPAIRKPLFQQPDEEELHTSFEEAISDRLLAMHGRLSRLSNPILNVQGTERNTDAVFSTGISTSRTMPATESVKFLPRPTISWKRATIFACSAMMFMLLGFDFLGLLMLHVH
jgi:hypothetical protein